MTFLDTLERRFGRLAFPGFLRFYALFQALVFGLHFLRPELDLLLEFDRRKIMAGEVWRVVTFLFVPAAGGNGMVSVIFFIFLVMITFMISDALEGAWGVFRASLFYYCGIAGLVAANFLYGAGVEGSGFFLYEASFFAFATLFPRVTFLLMFVIPVQVRFLAIFGAAVLFLPLLMRPLEIPYYLLSFGNYLLFVAVPFLRGRMRKSGAPAWTRKVKAQAGSSAQAFHTCKTCGRTEIDNPSLEFRVGADGEDYCAEHLPKS